MTKFYSSNGMCLKMAQFTILKYDKKQVQVHKLFGRIIFPIDQDKL